MWPPRIIAERRGRVEEGRAGQDRHGLLAGVDQIGVLVAVERVRPDAEDAVLRLQDDGDVVGDVVRHQGRQADAEVDVLPVLELAGGAGGQLLAGQRTQAASASSALLGRARAHRASLDALLATGRRADDAPRAARRCPACGCGRGRARPGSTSSSTSAMVSRPGRGAQRVEVARADSSKTRLPCRSPLPACTSAKSVVIASSSTYVAAAVTRGSPSAGDASATEPSGRVAPGSPPSATWVPTPAGGEEGGDAGAAGAQPLGERALRDELDLELAGEELALELLVLADVGRRRPGDPLGARAGRPRPQPSTPQLFETTSQVGDARAS